MARPIQRRRPALLPFDKEIPQIKVDQPLLWYPPKGLDLTSRLSRVTPDYCTDISNVMLDDGTLVSRLGTEVFDAPYSGEVMAVVGFVAPSTQGYLLRVTTTDLQAWDGAGWNTIPNITFTGSTTDYFSFAAFGDLLLIANGVDKIAYYNALTGESGFIDESPVAKHITSFNGRVVASYTIEGDRKPYRVRWSIKYDAFDWTGDGSGFEDLFAVPGGFVDTVHGVFPISDDTALIVRESSVWQMSVTGNLLTPHRFTRVYAEMGTSYRRSIAMIPGGIIYLTRENIAAISTNDIKRVGDKVRKTILGSITDVDVPIGKYDYKRMEYRLAVGNTVWRYNFRDQGWTRDAYPLLIRDMTRVELTNFVVPIDSLPAVFGPTIDSLPLTIDELVGTADLDSFFFVGY